MFPRAHERHVERQTPRTSCSAGIVATCAAAADASRKVVGAVAPADHHGVDAVLGRAFDVVRSVADHEYAVGKRLQVVSERAP